MSCMGWACHAVSILANHSLDVLATLGVVDGDAVTAVKNSQAVVAVIGAWLDNELHKWFLFVVKLEACGNPVVEPHKSLFMAGKLRLASSDLSVSCVSCNKPSDFCLQVGNSGLQVSFVFFSGHRTKGRGSGGCGHH